MERYPYEEKLGLYNLSSDRDEQRLQVWQVVVLHDSVSFQEVCALFGIEQADEKRWRQVDRALQWARRRGSIVSENRRWRKSGDPRNQDRIWEPPLPASSYEL